jgi:predicted Rossmann fold flavoprotein
MMPADPKTVAVVGCGPAGILAAGRAAELGARVTVLEKGPVAARKLRISGKGRGNITNTSELNDFIEAFSPNGKFLYGPFSRFFRDDLLKLLAGLGVETKIERGGRVFPVSDRAADVADALIEWMTGNGARLRPNSRVKSLLVEHGRVVGVDLYGGRMKADAVIVATGGASYPKTGSTGDGYDIAREVGHTIVTSRSALAPLVTSERWVKRLAGLSLRNVEASLLVASGDGERMVDSEFGEMLFTHTGVSGPTILTLSRIVPALLEQGTVVVSIDLKPALSEAQLHDRLIRDFTATKHFRNYLSELLPRLLIDVFVELAGIDPHKPLNSVTASERDLTVTLLKDFRVTVSRMGALDEAIVTAGGVSLKEVDPRTMMSKMVYGLYFAGEVLDIDAITGGYNLQAAFSTGWVAGDSAAN